MPTRIRILADDAINKIAAGEVVERPASIVKELVENAIDADADRITIEVDGGGRDRIRIADNGCGMSRDDALLSLERHATSKIRDASDLANLRTLGFRGEALPSIAAVSRMSIETRDAGATGGTRVDVDGGTIRDVADIGREPGTTVTVDRLFHSTPARRKFLKAADTEWRHVSQTVTGLALANAGVAFTLSHDGRETLRLTAGSVQERLEALFGVRIGDGAFLVDDETAGVSVRGYVEAPERARKRAVQPIVVNGRWVQHRGIVLAVTDGYGGLLQKEASPAFALCVDVAPSAVDVNVHPSKREVKFSDPRAVYRAVADAVRRAVRVGGAIPDLSRLESTPVIVEGGVGVDDETLARPVAYGRPAPGHDVAADQAAALREPLSLDDSQIALPLSIQKEAAEPAAEEKSAEPVVGRSRFFQVHARYIIAQVKQGLIIVDQNLAHQRVVYEQAVRQMEADGEASGQTLLFPATFDFGLDEIVAVREVMPLLGKMGFGIRDFGGNTVVVDAVPAGLDAWDEGALLRALVDDLVSERTAHLDLGDRSVDPAVHFLATSYARRVAIPHGRAMGQDEMEHLIDTLFGCAEPYASPSGRPTLSRLSLEDLARRFGP